MLSLIAALVLQDQGSTIKLPGNTGAQPPVITPLPGSNGEPSLLGFVVGQESLPNSKLSPKTFGNPAQRWPFDWLTLGYVQPFTSRNDYSWHARFRIFSQSETVGKTLAPSVVREYLRLWDLCKRHLGIDHSSTFNAQMVDVYLCREGQAGGEQLFATDDEGGAEHKVDTIYIYDLPSFIDNLEQAREIAHEYGHAVLPGVGGYTKPEYWAGGYLGEKLFLRWIQQDMAAGRLKPEDAMGATLPDLTKWLRENVNPLVAAAAVRLPNSPLLSQTNEEAMNAYHGLVLYCDTIMPPHMFSRSLQLISSQKAADAVNAAVLAAEEATYKPNIPPSLYGKDVWIPVGSGKVVGTPVLKRNSGWELVRPSAKLKVIASADGKL